MTQANDQGIKTFADVDSSVLWLWETIDHQNGASEDRKDTKLCFFKSLQITNI